MATLPITKEALAWANFDNLIHRNYLSFLDQATVVSERTRDGFDFHKDCDCVQMDCVARIVYDKNENTLAKLNNVYSSLVTAGQSVFVLIRRKENEEVEIYVGARGVDEESGRCGRETVEDAIRGNFPGLCLKPVMDDKVRRLSRELYDMKCVSMVTGIPDIKDGTEDAFSQGIEKVLESQGNHSFSALLLAMPMSRLRLLQIERGYQELASQLSLLNISQFSLSKQESVSIGRSISDSVSEALSRSLSLSESRSESHTDGTGTSRTRNVGGVVGGGIAAAGTVAGAVVGSMMLPGLGTAAGAAVGGAVATVAGAVGSLVGGLIGSTTKSENHSDTTTNSKSTTETEGKTTTTTVTTTASTTTTETNGTSVAYNVQDRMVADAISIVDEQLKRIRTAKSYGAWRFAAYFISNDESVARTGANVFAGLLRGERTGVERCAVSNWKFEDRNFKSIIADLSCFEHPHFNLGKDTMGNDVVIEPTSVVTTRELSIGMSLPMKSLPGIRVFESVEFGRSVTTYDEMKGSRRVEIGYISHLGAKTTQTVDLNVDSLTSHLFVTGSTGSGKSNFIYGLLNGLLSADVRLLVIEPAKGEYKDVFGGVRGVSVYGTNPYQTELLRVNPFAFPDKIHVMEHIDRLIEILNAAWPMYAAMPAILKDAVEQTYKNLGWDLIRSTCSHEKPVYPDFHDLLKVLPEVINASAYDQEVKSNYTGSLLTRVKSLTNGYYRTIFQKDELPPGDLFDKSCIVDISRVGSTETKSLLMGILFLKLQEYRMANPPERNSGLRHITVFEEAHNLLRKTSTEQGMESANLAGKSVEMLTNAIAEMRTYGEGFVIADQAPGLLDPAVIRNTNTKVVFRLPDYDDRLLVGKAENLSDEQINELARLPTGCAAVYQNNWQEAVLCQTKKYDEKLSKPLDVSKLGGISIDSRTQTDGVRIKVLIARASKKIDFRETLRKLTKDERIKATLPLYFPDDVFLSNDDLPDGVVLDEVYRTLVKPAVSETAPVKDRRTWTSLVLKRIFDNEAVRLLEDSEKDNLVEVVFRSLSRYDNDPEQAKGWIEQSQRIEDWRVWK